MKPPTVHDRPVAHHLEAPAKLAVFLNATPVVPPHIEHGSADDASTHSGTRTDAAAYLAIAAVLDSARCVCSPDSAPTVTLAGTARCEE